MKIYTIGKPSSFSSQLAQELNVSSPMTLAAIQSGTANLKEPKVAVVEMGRDVSIKSLIPEARRENALLLLRNVEQEHLKEVSPIGIDASTVILNNFNDGRQQQLVVFGTRGNANSEVPVIAPPESSLSELERLDSETDQSRKDERPLAAEEIPIVKTLEFAEVQTVASWLSQQDKIRDLYTTPDRPGWGWDKHNNSYAIANVIFPTKRWNCAGTEGTIDGSFDVELIASTKPRKKFVRIRAVCCNVHIVNMFFNSWDKKGHFTRMGRVIVYPGDEYTFHSDEVKMPEGWRCRELRPRTRNGKSTYTRTTGMTVGGDVGGTLTGKGSQSGAEVGAETGAELNVSFSDSNTESTTIEDFQVMNRSTSAFCHWEYWHSALFPEGSEAWDRVTTRSKELGFLKRRNIKTPPNLALTTLPMENEVVFEAPADAHNRQRFILHLGHDTALLAQIAKWPNDCLRLDKDAKGMWTYLDVHMDFVSHPR